MRFPGELRDVAEDRRDVPIAVEHYGGDDEGQRKPGGRHLRARPDGAGEREDRGDDDRPAHQVVEEGGALEEPGVLLVHQNALPETRKPAVTASRHHWLWSFPRASPSS